MGNLWSSALHIVPSIVYYRALCTVDIAIPGRVALYRGLYAKVQAVLLPFRSAGYVPGPPQLDCAVLHGSALLWLGVIIPVWFCAGMERRAWQRWQGRDVRALSSPQKVLLTLCAVALSPAVCLIVVKGIVASCQMIEAAWGVEPF